MVIWEAPSHPDQDFLIFVFFLDLIASDMNLLNGSRQNRSKLHFLRPGSRDACISSVVYRKDLFAVSSPLSNIQSQLTIRHLKLPVTGGSSGVTKLDIA
jgi:hypothetical protein